MYDLDRFGGELLFSTLKTHPKVLVGGLIHENPYYIPPRSPSSGGGDTCPPVNRRPWTPVRETPVRKKRHRRIENPAPGVVDPTGRLPSEGEPP
jgi:hypothetical protein